MCRVVAANVFLAHACSLFLIKSNYDLNMRGEQVHGKS